MNEEDEGEMYDKLFDKYGKVVYSRNDKKSPSAEIDDDAESLSCKSSIRFVTGDKLFLLPLPVLMVTSCCSLFR